MANSFITKDPEVIAKEEFYSQAAAAIKQNEIDDVCFEEDLYNKPVFDFLLHCLPHYPYEIKKTIKVSLERGKDKNCFIIGCEELNKFGIGLTKDEAMEDFEHNVVTDYLLLNDSDPDKLSIDAKQLLNLYRSYIALR